MVAWKCSDVDVAPTRCGPVEDTGRVRRGTETSARRFLARAGFQVAATPAQQALLRQRLGNRAARMRVSELAGSRLLVKTRPDFTGGMGAPCWVAFDTERWHLFEKPSGVAYF